MQEKSLAFFLWTCITNMTNGFKDNRDAEKWNFYCKLGIQLLISRFFIFRSESGFQIWVWNLRFTSYFNASFNLFLSNCWLLVFGFLQGSAVKSRVWTYFSVNYSFFAQEPRIRVFKPGFQNPGFQFPVSNTNWYFIFQVTPVILNSRFTLKSPLKKLSNQTRSLGNQFD